MKPSHSSPAKIPACTEMTETIFFRQPQRLPEKPQTSPTHNKKALRMKYECYIQCSEHPKTMLKNMLSNIAAHKENFQILIQDYRPPFPHQEHRYDDAPYHVFNGRDALEHFELLYQSVSSRLVFSQSGQLSLALFDSFDTYAHMYDSDFQFLKTAFSSTSPSISPPPPASPNWGKSAPANPSTAFTTCPTHTPSTSAPCSNATKNVKSKTNPTCCSAPAPNTSDSPQVGYLYPTPAKTRNL